MIIDKEYEKKLSDEAKELYNKYLKDYYYSKTPAKVNDIRLTNENEEYVQIRVYVYWGLDHCFDLLFNKKTNKLDISYYDDYTYHYYGEDYELTHHDCMCDSFHYSKEFLNINIGDFALSYEFIVDNKEIIKFDKLGDSEIHYSDNNVIIDYKKDSLLHSSCTKIKQKNINFSKYLCRSELIKKFKNEIFIRVSKSNNEYKYYYKDNGKICLSIFVDEEKEIILKEVCGSETCIHYYYGYDHIIVYSGENKSITHYRKNNQIFYINSIGIVKAEFHNNEYLMFKINSNYKYSNYEGAIYDAFKYQIEDPFDYFDDPILEQYEDLYYEEKYEIDLYEGDD